MAGLENSEFVAKTQFHCRFKHIIKSGKWISYQWSLEKLKWILNKKYDCKYTMDV